MNKFEHLFQPIQVKNVLVRNRVVMAPMNNDYASPRGEVTSQVIEYFVERAKGGVGLIITSATAVDERAKKRIGELCIYSDDYIDGLKDLTAAVHNEGAKIFLQMVHVGRELISNTTEQFPYEPVGPSAIPHPLTGDPCHELTVEEIHAIQAKFIAGAQRAEKAGFDGVEVHGAHGYLITQFTNPFTNRRTDEYGGGIEGRMRFPLEVAKGIREKTGKGFLICYRLNVNELFEPGIMLHIDESLLLAKRISDFVDLIHVSTGGTGTPQSTRKVIPLMSTPRGCYAPLAAAVKKVVTVPIICVGRITTPETAESILARGDADLVAIGRGLLTDPYWVDKAKKGRSHEIRRCIACNQGCMEYLALERKITCLHNAAVGRERELAITPARKKKKVLVVGGGVAGMEAARVAALRGHEVELWEKASILGGNANLASITPWRREFKEVVNYLVNQMKKLDIPIRLNTEGTLSKTVKYGPDVVIMATGSRPRTTQVLDSANGRVFLAEEVLLGKAANAVSPVCVIGGGLVGIETAAFLKLFGHDVAVVEMLPEIGTDMGAFNKGFWLDKVKELGISAYTGCEVIGQEENMLQVRVTGEEDLKKIGPFSSFVIAIGYESTNSLLKELEEEKEKLPFAVHAVGDCLSPRNALHAIHEGYEIAHSL